MKKAKRRPKPMDPATRAFLKKMGTKLAQRRKEIGYPNSDAFAYDHDINRAQYGKYEAGSQDMRVSSLLRTLHALGFTLDEFFTQGFDPR
jgi:hypothetical protein